MKKIKIYKTFEEQELDKIKFMASLSHEESMAVFFELIKRSRIFSNNEPPKPFKKIIIDHDFRLWE